MKYLNHTVSLLAVLVLSSFISSATINIPSDYSTIQAGLNAAQAGDTVLVQPGTYTENIIWPDVNGIKLISDGDSSNTVIDGNSNSTVINFVGIGSIDTTTLIDGFTLTNGGNVPNGGGLILSESNPLINKCRISENNSTDKGGGIYIVNSSPILSNCSITSNYTINGGGGIYASGSNPKIRDCKITGNSISSNQGAGLYYTNSSGIINSSNISLNTGGSYGGGMYLGNSSNPLIEDSSILLNNAGSYGGGISCWGSSPNIVYCNISNNQAGHGGGGIEINSGSYPIIDNVLFDHNSSQAFGGAIYCAQGGSPDIKNSIFKWNTSAKGGAIFAGYSSNLTVVSSIFVHNSASEDGGAINSWNNTFSINECSISENTANKGGGLYYNASFGGSLDSTTIARNSANYGGGIYGSFYNGYTVYLYSNTIVGNMALIDGDGIYLTSGDLLSAIGGNICYNNQGVYNSNVPVSNLIEVFWGDSSGPYHPSQNPNGLGDSVNAFVNVTPWLTEPETSAPHIPVQNIRITSSENNYVQLSWDSSSIVDLAGYKVYYDNDTSGYPYANTVDVGNSISYTISGLSLATSYYFSVTAYDIDGNESWYSNEVVAITNRPPQPFDLIFPYNNTIIQITRDNNWTDTLYFAWEQSIDADGDPVTYRFILTDGLSLFNFGETTTNIYKIPYYLVEHYMHSNVVEVVTGNWTVVASAEDTSTWATNGPFTLTIDASAVSIDESEVIPESFSLHQNYPNPFNPITTIRYDLPEASRVELTIFDMLGRKVRTVVNREEGLGFKSVVWDSTNDLGETVSAGVYLYQIRARDYKQTRKMVLLE